LSLPFISDNDDDSSTTPFMHSAQSKNNRQKQKSNISTNYSNQSHTYFFWIDYNNSELVYCKICELNLKDTNKKPYAYTRKDGNTTSMINHLRDKHNITKDNYTRYLDEHSEVRLLIYQ